MKKVIFAIFCMIFFSGMAHAADATGCPAGQYYDNTQGCTTCKSGTWSAGGTATSCSTCQMPNGATGTSTGNTSATSCSWKLTCEAGTHWDGSSCASCFGTGYYSDSETTYTGTGNSLSAKQCKSECTSPAITNETGTGCKCPNNNYTQEGDKCVPKTYEITLDENCKLCALAWEQTTFVKYGLGFASKKNASDSKFAESPNTAVINGNIPKRTCCQFHGYYTAEKGGQQIFGPTLEGKLPQTNKYFEGDMTLYARWDEYVFYITYKSSDAEDAKSYQQRCTDSNDCIVKTFSSTNFPQASGKIFTKWKCAAASGSSACPSTYLNPGDKIPPNDPQSYTLTPQWQDCPKGHYCANGTQTPCPIGSTTSGTGKTSINECVMVRGNGGTKFCDKDNNCFYLPGDGNIAY